MARENVRSFLKSCTVLIYYFLFENLDHLRYEKVFSFILFFHRITDNHMVKTPLKNPRDFQKLCGKEGMGRVILVTTMWDEVEKPIGLERLRELKKSYLEAMITGGSKTFALKNDRASAKKLLEMIVQDKPRPVTSAKWRRIRLPWKGGSFSLVVWTHLYLVIRLGLGLGKY